MVNIIYFFPLLYSDTLNFKFLIISFLLFSFSSGIREKLGGTLPTSIEVNCPLVHARVSIPIQETGAGWKDVTRDYVIRQCTNVLENSFAWKTVIELPITRGKRLELCWKMDTKLDWVWLRDYVDGVRRDWDVLFGLVIQKVGALIFIITILWFEELRVVLTVILFNSSGVPHNSNSTSHLITPPK